MKSKMLGVSLMGFVLALADAAFAQDVTVDGNLLMHNSSDTVGNILKDGVPFVHNFGPLNTFVGLYSGNLSTTGRYNSGLGNSALFSLTTGDRNTATGAQALQSNSTGSNNTASGVESLVLNSSGNNNTAIGVNALHNNTEGFDNTAVGVDALAHNGTVFGVSGFDNTAVGAGALQNNVDGNSNTASGYHALWSNGSGRDNTASGRDALGMNTFGESNTADGALALGSNTTGGGNTGLGVGALYFNTTGRNNTAIGTSADVARNDLTNATAIGAGAVVDSSNKIRLGNSEVTVVEGPPYQTVSDRTKKENFRPVNGKEVLRKISGFSLTTWNYIGQDANRFRHYGPMAQDFFAAFGHDDVGTIGTPTTITSSDLDGVLLAAVQALEKRSAEQKKQLDAQRAENAALKARLEALEHFQTRADGDLRVLRPLR